MPQSTPIWRKRPKLHDFAGAEAFLSLLYSPARARKLIKALHGAKTVERAAKDLLRASQLPLLSREDPHVTADLEKIHKRKALPPVLLIRGDIGRRLPLIVADGYHRICAIYYYDEGVPIPCRMVAP